MRKNIALSLTIACALFLFTRSSRAAADKIFGNLTYSTSCPYISDTVTLANGQGVVWNYRLHVSMYYEGHYVYSDFNGDGLKDAAAIIGESQGGSDDEIQLAFLIYDGKRLVHKKSIYLGNSVIIHSLKARDGKIIVDMLAHQDGDCAADPTLRVKRVFDGMI